MSRPVRTIGHCSAHGNVPLFMDRCSLCLARDFPKGAVEPFPANMREAYAKFLAEGKSGK